MKMTSVLLLLCALCLLPLAASAQGTAFTYEGRLIDGGAPANGSYDVQFKLFNAASAGSQVGGTLTNQDVVVSNGLFVATVDFGSGVFTGMNLWLELAVRPGASTGSFTPLNPRQPLLPVPYAIQAANATAANTASSLSGTIAAASITGTLPDARLSGNVALLNGSPGFSGAVTASSFSGSGAGLISLNASSLTSGTVADARLSGNVARLNGTNLFTGTNTFAGATLLTNRANSFSGNGAGLTNVNATALGGLGSNSFWQLGGNGGTATGSNFLGTLDNQPLEIRVNNARVLRLEPNVTSPNVIGGFNRNSVSNGVIGGFIGGGGYAGNSNFIAGNYSVIAGGSYNRATGLGTTVGGGQFNLATADAATIAGGNSITASGSAATVGGGGANIATNIYATVPGGLFNLAGGQYSFAAGRQAKAIHDGSFVWGDSQNANFASTGVNQFLIRAAGGVGINLNNPAAALDVNGRARMTQFQLGSSAVAGQILTADAAGVGSWQTSAFVAKAGDTMTGDLTLNASLTLDAVSVNNGSYYPGLVFGAASGETISSKRTSGGNRYGIDFYTGFNPRMSIANSGNVGIGTTSPGGKLEINTGNGSLQFIDDLVPGLNLTGGTIPGTMRFRNTLEVFPSLDGTREGKIDVRDTTGNPNIILRGSGVATVKVLEITGGADIAEPFQISAAGEIPKGAVVVIDEDNPGRLKLSDRAYDTRVAGIVSGANGINPGLALHQQGVLEGGRNVALTGRVYALADANDTPIKPGDLLTTSDTPGHVMKVTDRGRGSGAILGKAMTALKEGKGMVLVLVSLQ